GGGDAFPTEPLGPVGLVVEAGLGIPDVDDVARADDRPAGDGDDLVVVEPDLFLLENPVLLEEAGAVFALVIRVDAGAGVEDYPLDHLAVEPVVDGGAAGGHPPVEVSSDNGGAGEIPGLPPADQLLGRDAGPEGVGADVGPDDDDPRVLDEYLTGADLLGVNGAVGLDPVVGGEGPHGGGDRLFAGLVFVLSLVGADGLDVPGLEDRRKHPGQRLLQVGAVEFVYRLQSGADVAFAEVPVEAGAVDSHHPVRPFGLQHNTGVAGGGEEGGI